MSDNLELYLNQWSLCEPQAIAQTFTSTLYKVMHKGEDAVLKLLNEAGAKDECGGAVALKCFAGNGAVRLLACDQQAHLLEFIPGNDLKHLVKQGQDEQASTIIAKVLNKLHGSREGTPPLGLKTLDERFGSLLKRASNKSEPEVYKRAGAVAENLLKNQKQQCVLHGDMHHENVIFSKQRGWLAIDPKGLFGERTFDAANVLQNPDIPELVLNESRYRQTAQIIAEHMDLDVKRLLAFSFAFSALSASWSIEDGQDPSVALSIAQRAESMM